MMRSIGVAVCAATMLAAVPAQAATYILKTTLSGANEVPVVMSAGTGTVTLTLNDTANTLLIATTFSGLTGTTSAAHIHCCQPLGTNAGVATVPPVFPGFPTGVTAGTYSQTFDLTQSSFYNPSFVTANGGVTGARNAFVAGLIAGQTYFNIHTTAFPGGEIRGQLAVVPEPASWALLIAGFGLAGTALRTRRRAFAFG